MMILEPWRMTTKVELFRVGSGDDTVYEIRFSHYEDQHLYGYETSPIRLTARSVPELEEILHKALAALQKAPIQARGTIRVSREIE